MFWSAQLINNILKGEDAPYKDFPVQGFSIDTRTLSPQQAFLAVQGEMHHGNSFISHAIEKGASIIITDKKVKDPCAIPILYVDSSLVALRKLAVFARYKFKGKVCAITGTSGKTSVKEALAFLLQRQGFSVHYSYKSYNNHLGVPLTLANMPWDADIGIIEIGTNSPGEIADLSSLVRPHVGGVVTVGPGHIGFFKNVEEIAQEKFSLYDHILPGGTAFIPIDSEFSSKAIEKTNAFNLQTCLFGQDPQADIRLVDYTLIQDGKIELRLHIQKKLMECILPTNSLAWAHNAPLIVGIVQILGADLDAAVEALSCLPIPQGRGAVHTLDYNGWSFKLIDDAYNANPLSMEMALRSLANYSQRKIAILGDMLELGSETEIYHEKMLQLCNDLNIHKVILGGPQMCKASKVVDNTRLIERVEEADPIMDVLRKNLQKGDIVLFKSSQGTGLHKVVDKLIKESSHTQTG